MANFSGCVQPLEMNGTLEWTSGMDYWNNPNCSDKSFDNDIPSSFEET